MGISLILSFCYRDAARDLSQSAQVFNDLDQFNEVFEVANPMLVDAQSEQKAREVQRVAEISGSNQPEETLSTQKKQVFSTRASGLLKDTAGAKGAWIGCYLLATEMANLIRMCAEMIAPGASASIEHADNLSLFAILAGLELIQIYHTLKLMINHPEDRFKLVFTRLLPQFALLGGVIVVGLAVAAKHILNAALTHAFLGTVHGLKACVFLVQLIPHLYHIMCPSLAALDPDRVTWGKRMSQKATQTIQVIKLRLGFHPMPTVNLPQAKLEQDKPALTTNYLHHVREEIAVLKYQDLLKQYDGDPGSDDLMNDQAFHQLFADHPHIQKLWAEDMIKQYSVRIIAFYGKKDVPTFALLPHSPEKTPSAAVMSRMTDHLPCLELVGKLIIQKKKEMNNDPIAETEEEKNLDLTHLATAEHHVGKKLAEKYAAGKAVAFGNSLVTSVAHFLLAAAYVKGHMAVMLSAEIAMPLFRTILAPFYVATLAFILTKTNSHEVNHALNTARDNLIPLSDRINKAEKELTTLKENRPETLDHDSALSVRQ